MALANFVYVFPTKLSSFPQIEFVLFSYAKFTINIQIESNDLAMTITTQVEGS